MNSIRIALLFAFASTVSLGQERAFDKVLKDIKEAAVPAVNWGFEQAIVYPQVPGIFIAGMMRAGKQAIIQKPASFMIWALFGSTVLAEGCKITATNYLNLHKTHGERRISDTWLQDLKVAKDTAVKTASELLNEDTKKSSDEEKKD